MATSEQLEGSRRLIERIRNQLESRPDPQKPYDPQLYLEDLEKLFSIGDGSLFEDRVRFLSLSLRGQPNPDTVSGYFAAEDSEDLGELVKTLLGDYEDRLQLQMTLVNMQGASTVGSITNVPYGGVGQPTPEAASKTR